VCVCVTSDPYIGSFISLIPLFQINSVINSGALAVNIYVLGIVIVFLFLHLIVYIIFKALP
jgi:hypothetical protein